jgi:hypothetical protein
MAPGNLPLGKPGTGGLERGDVAVYNARIKEHNMRVRYAFGIAVIAALLAPAGVAVQGQTPAPALKKMAPPLRGTVEVGYMMSAKRVGDKIVTTFEVKNLSATGSIVALQIEQFFYDKAGNPIQGTGDRQRLKQPLQPGEVTTFVLTSSTVPGMTSPAHKFTFRDGLVKPVLLKTMK